MSEYFEKLASDFGMVIGEYLLMIFLSTIGLIGFQWGFYWGIIWFIVACVLLTALDRCMQECDEMDGKE